MATYYDIFKLYVLDTGDTDFAIPAGATEDRSIIGNADANTLTGDAHNNTLDGAGGVDVLIGGLGNDTYVVDDATETVTEASITGSGIDTVIASVTLPALAANIENLVLTGTATLNGTGNALNNAITGNSAANILTGAEGDDVLDGGGAADRLVGGIGNDTYIVDNAGDVVVEDSIGGSGTDRVFASVTHTLAANVENLILTGSAVINGTGNTLNNSLIGNGAANSMTGAEGNDTLDGGGGIDQLIGGIGDDTYMVDNAGDVFTEAAASGTDTIVSSVNFSLVANVENLGGSDRYSCHSLDWQLDQQCAHRQFRCEPSRWRRRRRHDDRRCWR